MSARRVDPMVAGVPLLVDGAEVFAAPGEMLATALLAAGDPLFRADTAGRARGLYCNMGSCGECMVEVETAGRTRRVRACLTPVAAGMIVRRRRA